MPVDLKTLSYQETDVDPILRYTCYIVRRLCAYSSYE